VKLVPSPQGAALFAQTGFWIVRRVDEQRGGGKIFCFSPSELPVLKEVVLDPDPTQDLDRRNLPQPVGSQRIEHGSQHFLPIFPNLFGQSEAIPFRFGQAAFLNAVRVSLDPLGITAGHKPLGGDNSETVEAQSASLLPRTSGG